jgi:hypothetical protein
VGDLDPLLAHPRRQPVQRDAPGLLLGCLEAQAGRLAQADDRDAGPRLARDQGHQLVWVVKATGGIAVEPAVVPDNRHRVVGLQAAQAVPDRAIALAVGKGGAGQVKRSGPQASFAQPGLDPGLQKRAAHRRPDFLAARPRDGGQVAEPDPAQGGAAAEDDRAANPLRPQGGDVAEQQVEGVVVNRAITAENRLVDEDRGRARPLGHGAHGAPPASAEMKCI